MLKRILINTLNAAGDKKYAHYDFWIVKEDAPPNANSFHWERAS
ncbi:MAG: hypothetical protein WA220_09910 [Candidatus Nitrosopolaris sp.]